MQKNTLKQKTDNFLSKKLDWPFIQQEMKNKFGAEIYESWIKKIEFVNEFHDYILISVSTRFIRDWITSRYLDQILQLVKSKKKNINRIEFVIRNSETEEENDIKKYDSRANENVSFIKDSYLHIIELIPIKLLIILY